MDIVLERSLVVSASSETGGCPLGKPKKERARAEKQQREAPPAGEAQSLQGGMA